jgi:hypothetical protein
MYGTESKVCRLSAAYAGAALALAASSWVGIVPARADVFELANGGRVEGKQLITDDANKLDFTIELAGGGRVTVSRSQVTKIDPKTDVDTEYAKMARSSPDTVDAHWKLAEWCREHKHRDERRQHLERILELNPNHVDARAALGFHEKNGQWMNRDDVMASRGLVLYDGKYVTTQQVELMKEQKETKVTQADWTRRIDQLRRQLSSPRPDKSNPARVAIQNIQDPQAADAIVNALHRERDPQVRRLWVETASRLKSRVAIDALVDMSLNDQDDDMRHLCLDNLIRYHRQGLATPYIHALGNKDNEVINRAGAALGQIGDRDAIGPLIEALVTKHKIKVSDASADQHSYTFSRDGGGGGGSFSFGGGGPQFIMQSVRNRAVLDALITISGNANFEYDQVQWRGWLAAQAKAAAIDVRRDP